MRLVRHLEYPLEGFVSNAGGFFLEASMTADERLALVQRKIDRANHHIVDLYSAIRAFFESKPYEIGAKRNPETRQLIYYLERIEPIPENLALITGDVLFNLRSALDHLAQQVYLVANPRGVFRDKSSFPLRGTPRNSKTFSLLR